MHYRYQIIARFNRIIESSIVDVTLNKYGNIFILDFLLFFNHLKNIFYICIGKTIKILKRKYCNSTKFKQKHIKSILNKFQAENLIEKMY